MEQTVLGRRVCYRRLVCSQPVLKGASYDDIKRLPPDVTGEILAGQLYTQPRLSNLHAAFTSGLGMDLGTAFQRGRGGPGGWFIIFEPELHLGDDIVEPDLAGWRRERLAEIPDEPYFSLAPDWVCEVISPGTARRDRTVKLDIYRRESVLHYWIVNPRSQTIEILRLDGEGYRIVDVCAGDDKVRAEPFDAIELDLGELWPTDAK